MRMSGYPAKTRSLSWSHDGKWLATSGAEAAIVWPFESKEGPMGKPPRECGVRPAKVDACRVPPPKPTSSPSATRTACILLIRLTDASELLVRPGVPGNGDHCLRLGQGAGQRLAFGGADGQAGVLTLPT